MLTHEDKILLQQADDFYQEGKYNEALINYNDVLLSFSIDGIAYYRIAKTYFKLQQPKVAITNFEKACKLLADFPQYQARKEFAGMLSQDQFHKEASQYYLPVASKAKTEEDLIIGIQYLLKVENIDTSEQLLAKHISRFPNAFDQAMKISNIESYVLERLKNRKRSILKALKNNFQPTLDSSNDELDFLEKNSEKDTYNQLITDWERTTEDFDYAESVEDIVTAKNKLTALSKNITTEKITLEQAIERREIAELKLGHLKQVSQLNELDMELNSILPKLPETSLKIDIPPFLNVVKDFKSQILRQDYTTVRRAYLNLSNLIEQGNFLKAEAKKTIERMLKPSELETAIVAAKTQALEQRPKKPSKRTEDDFVIIDSQTGKRRRRRGIPWVWIFLGLILIGGAAFIIIYGGLKKEKRVLLTGVLMREYPDAANSPLVREASYPQGEALQVLADEGEWLKVKADDGNIGYMRSEYYVTPAEYTFIQGIFADQETKEFYNSNKVPARYKTTLLHYFIKNNWISNISDQVEKDIYGDISNREIRQIHEAGKETPFSSTVIMNLVPNGKKNNKEKKEFTCLIQGESDVHLIIYAYEDDNAPVEVYTKPIAGTNHLLKQVLDKNDNRNWYLGKRSFGQKVTEKLTSNALLLQVDQFCNNLYTYERDFIEEYPQLGCD